MAERQILASRNPAELRAMLNWWRSNARSLKDRSKSRTPRQRPNIAFVLLEELVVGGSANAVLLTRARSPETGAQREVAVVTVRGEPRYGGEINAEDKSTFRLVLSGVPTEHIDWDASADTVQAQMDALDAIEPGDVRVWLGRIAKPAEALTGHFQEDPDYILARWLIEFGGRFDRIDPPLLDVQDHIKGPALVDVQPGYTLRATDTIEVVHSVIPPGAPDFFVDVSQTETPMRRGAIGTAVWHHGIGYVIPGLESRAFKEPFTHEPYY